MDLFAKAHPIVNVLYYITMIVITFVCYNPIVLGITLATSGIYLGVRAGMKRVGEVLAFASILAILAIVMNPVFNHQGITILCYVWDSPITLESIIFGLVTGEMLIAAILLFANLHDVMTSDKIGILFNKISAKLAILFSLSLRFVPKFRKDYEKINRVSIGARGKKHSFAAISTLVGISLEDAVDTTDSMRARGYLIQVKKTHYQTGFTFRDMVWLWIMGIVFVVVFVGKVLAKDTIKYFPYVHIEGNVGWMSVFYVSFAVFACLPIFAYGKELVKWKKREKTYFK